MPGGTALLGRVSPVLRVSAPSLAEIRSSSQASCSPRVLAEQGSSWRQWSDGAFRRSRAASSSHKSEFFGRNKSNLSARRAHEGPLGSGISEPFGSGTSEEESRKASDLLDPYLKHNTPVNLSEKSGSSESEFEQQLSMAKANPAYKRLSQYEKPSIDGENGKVEAIQIQEFHKDAEGKEAEPRFQPVLRNVMVCCIASFLFGYHLGVVNGPLEYIARDLGFAGDSILKGAIVSSTLGAAFLGSLAGGSLADKVGRKKTFQLTAVPLFIGAAVSATTTSVQPMILGRFIVGLGLGVSASAVPLYISEVAPTQYRGLLGSVNQVAACTGILTALLLGLPLKSVAGWWRTMFWAATVPALALAVGMGMAAESPRWLFKNGRHTEAEAVISRMWGPWCVKSAVEGLQSAAGPVGQAEVSWGELFSRRYRKVVLVGAFIFLLQQFAGINAVFYFSSSVFQKAGIKSEVLASAGMGVANLAAAIAALGLMDKLGRRKLLMYSFAGMAASLLLQVASMTVPALMPYGGVIAVVGTILYVVSFAMGAGPVPALLLPEMFPTRIRSKALAIAMATHWVCNFCIGLYFLRAVQLLGIPTIYTIFASVALMAVAFTYKNVVETKGRSLEEIERVMCPAPA